MARPRVKSSRASREQRSAETNEIASAIISNDLREKRGKWERLRLARLEASKDKPAK